MAAIIKGPDLDKARKILAKVIIGADGPGSVVGSLIGQTNLNLLTANQRTVKLNKPCSDIEVYLQPEFEGGYGWLFPKGEWASVGIGVWRKMRGKLRLALEGFMDCPGDRIGYVERVTTGQIPVGGPLDCVQGNVLLAGDAAGHTPHHRRKHIPGRSVWPSGGRGSRVICGGWRKRLT